MARDNSISTFPRTATRQAIFGRTIELLDKPEKTRIAYVVDDESIPASLHLSNFGEVCSAIDTTVASDFAKSEAKEVYRICAPRRRPRCTAARCPRRISTRSARP